MRVLAVDPGYDRLGVAVLEREGGKEVLLFSSCIETDRTASLPDRLLVLGREMERIICEYNPTALGIETLFFNANRTTAMGVASVRGMIIYLAKTHDCTVYEYSPQQIKVAVTGYGNSDKQAVFDMLTRLVPNIPKGRRDDEYDAIATGVTCLAHNPR